MCNFTYTFFECGHQTENNVRGCSTYKNTGNLCDPENPANRKNVKVKSVQKNGICDKCLKKEQEAREIASMQREHEKAREFNQAEAREREASHRAREDRILEESRQEYLRMQREADAEAEKIIRETREHAEREYESMNMDAMKAGLEASLRDLPDRYSGGGLENNTYDDDHSIRESRELISGGSRHKGGKDYEWELHMSTKITTSVADQVDISTPPPSPPPGLSPSPSPSPSPSLSASPPPSPSPPVAVGTPPPAPGPSTQIPVDFTTSPIGEQEYGHYWVGNRRMPIDPSQKQKSASGKSPSTTSRGPAPSVRLGGVINPSTRSAPGPRQPHNPQIGATRELLEKLNRRRKKIEDSESSEKAPK